MSKAHWPLLLSIATVLALGACSSERKHREAPAEVAGSNAISDQGRDPFGSEAAGFAATGEDVDDGGVPCPNFSLTIVGPFVQFVGEETTFSGHAQDDQRHEFKLSWSVSGGELSAKTGETTVYMCPEPGVQTISMTATLDAVCSSAVAHVVTCLKPVD